MLMHPSDYAKLDIYGDFNPDDRMYHIDVSKLTKAELKELIQYDLPGLLKKNEHIRGFKKERKVLAKSLQRVSLTNSADRIRRVIGYTDVLDRCCETAKHHPKGCTITLDDILDILEKQNYCCALTGIQFNSIEKPSIDRIDSKQGYHHWNVQILLVKVNIMKMALPLEDFLELCTKIVKHKKLV